MNRRNFLIKTGLVGASAVVGMVAPAGLIPAMVAPAGLIPAKEKKLRPVFRRRWYPIQEKYYWKRCRMYELLKGDIFYFEDETDSNHQMRFLAEDDSDIKDGV